MSEKSPTVALGIGIIDGLNQSIFDTNGVYVEGLRKQDFSKACVIPLATLRNWEQ